MIFENIFSKYDEVDRSSKFLKWLFGCHSWEKSVNPVYSTYKGGYGGWNDNMTKYEYFCLWGHLQFCYNSTDLIDNWVHISLHGYKNGYTYSPIKNLLWNFNWHIAYRKKFPFIKFGFDKVWKLHDYEKD